MGFASVEALEEALLEQAYLPQRGLSTALFLSLAIDKPLLLEGEAGVGKTELAKALARAAGARLIRLQCYEGLDVSHAVYEWNYARQLLELRILEAAGDLDRSTARRELYSEAFLLKRPLVSLELPILALNRDLDNVAW